MVSQAWKNSSQQESGSRGPGQRGKSFAFKSASVGTFTSVSSKKIRHNTLEIRPLTVPLSSPTGKKTESSAAKFFPSLLLPINFFPVCIFKNDHGRPLLAFC